MNDPSDVATEAKENRTFCVAGLQLPLCPLFTREGAARAFTFRPAPNDVILSSYPACDSPQLDAMLWKLLYTDLRPPPLDPATGRFLPCLEMATGGDTAYAHEHAASRKLSRLYKTYFPFRLIPFYRQARYIYVLRSPWDACLAYHRFLLSVGALDHRATPFDAFFEDFLEGDVPYGSYLRHVMPWNRRMGEGNVLIVCREHVEHNPRSTLFKMAAFLGDPYLKLLMDNEELERDILGGFTDAQNSVSAVRAGSATQVVGSTSCSERQLHEIMRKVSQHFGNSSLEFLWTNLFQKKLHVLPDHH